MRKKKRVICSGLVLALSASLLLSGCSRVDREKQESYRNLGIKQLSEGDYDSAVTNFQKALDESIGKIGDVEIDICFYKALAQYKNGAVADAIDTYTGLLEYDEKNADAYFLRGSAYLKSEEGKNCISDYNAAVKADPENGELYLEIYENLKAAGYEEKGKKYLEQALEQKVSDGKDYADRGRIYMLLEESQQAESAFDTAIEKGYDKAILYKGQLLASNGDTEGAQTLFDSYTEKYPEDVDALNQVGVLQMQAKEYDSALQIFEKAASLDGADSNQELQLNLIYAYEYTGDFAAALDHMQAYVKSNPDDATAQREYTFLQTRVNTASGSDSEKTDADTAKSEDTSASDEQ